MKKVLIITDNSSLELAKAFLATYLSDSAKFIGKILILKPSRESADYSLSLQPAGYEEVGTGIRAQWQALVATFKEGQEPFILAHTYTDDTFDLIVAVDSLAAETCLAGREPGTKTRTLVVRSSPTAISPAVTRAGKDTESVTLQFLRESIYSDNADRVETVFVPSDANRATICNNFDFIKGHVPFESVPFPIIETEGKDKVAVRSTMSLPNNSTLTAEDTVICVKLPTSADINIRQPNVAGLLDIMYELSEAYGKQRQPKWLVLCGNPSFRLVLKSKAIPSSLTGNIAFMGRGDADTFFDSEALTTALSASDIVLDMDRDHGYDIFLGTAIAWGIPVISSTQSSVSVKTIGSNLLGLSPEVTNTIRAIKQIIAEPTQKANKAITVPINHTIRRALEHDSI